MKHKVGDIFIHPKKFNLTNGKNDKNWQILANIGKKLIRTSLTVVSGSDKIPRTICNTADIPKPEPIIVMEEMLSSTP